ncbi:MAG: ABC transporter permease [Lachnospiraceae bacterium]|nr:ABC transporter permease [Lachnospiraceae bacterium]
MTLKTSSKVKLSPQRALIKNRTWLVSLLSLIAFIAYLISYVLVLHNDTTIGSQPGASIENYMGLTSGYSYFVTTIFAVLIGLTSYNYLYKAKTVDFYLSQPVSKMKYFVQVYLNGLGIYSIITGISYVVMALIGASFAGGLKVILLHGLISYLGNLVYFLAIFSICVLAQTISGTNFISVMMALFLLLAELVIRFTLGAMASEYFATFSDWNGRKSILLTSSLDIVSSPIYNQLMMLQQVKLQEFHSIFIPCVIKNFLIAVVAFVLAFFAYKYRKEEYSGKPIVFRFVETVLKVIVGVVAGIWGGYLMSLFWDGNYATSNVVIVIGIILTVVIICAIAEIVFHLDVKAFKRKAWQMPIIAVVSMVVIFSIKYDVIGYDHYIPKESDVEDCAIALTYSGITYVTEKNGTHTTSNGDYAERYMHIDDVKSFEQIAKIGMDTSCAIEKGEWEYLPEGISKESLTSENSVYTVELIYRMKNGKNVYRTVNIPCDVSDDIMNPVIGSDEYKEAAFHLSNIEALRANAKGKGKDTLLIVDTGNMTSVSESTIDELIECYRKDLKTYNFSVGKNESILGYIEYDNATENYDYLNSSDFTWTVPVFESFSNTIAFLKEKGIYNEDAMDAPAIENINQMRVTTSNVMVDGSYIDEISYDVLDEAEQLEILEKIVPENMSCGYDFWDSSNKYEPLEVYIETKDNNYYFTFRTGNVPDCLKEPFANVIGH